MSRDKAGLTSAEVIESVQWLRSRIDELTAGDDPLGAIPYVTRLLSAAVDTETRLYCYRTLGMLTFRAGNIEQSRRAFEDASDLSPEDPGIAYALSHCAAAQNLWWGALLHALEAFHFADDIEDEAEFMRVGAVAVRHLGKPDIALSMLLGALDRAPRNPWILETIGHIYESEQMWMEAIGVRDKLIDVLSDGIAVSERTPENVDNPQFYRVFQSFAVRFQITPEAIAARREEITERLRSEIGPADRDNEADDDAHLAPLNLPRGLATLVDQLADHDRNYRLLETAQTLWAKARHDRFDVQLTPNTLAAAIHWAVERLHWRIPTPIHKLSQVYQVVPETIRAAARLVVGRFEVEFLSLDGVMADIGPKNWSRLETLQKALLYGVPIEEVQPSIPMLGE